MTRFDIVCTICGNTEVKFTKSGLDTIVDCECGNSEAIIVGSQSDIPSMIMPFGKYKGKTIRWIVDNDLPYSRWAAENISSDSLRVKFSIAIGE